MEANYDQADSANVRKNISSEDDPWVFAMLKIISEQRELWDPAWPGYKNFHNRSQTWKTIAERVRMKTGIRKPEKTLKTRWETVRTAYRRKRRGMLKCSNSKYSRALKFLDNVILGGCDTIADEGSQWWHSLHRPPPDNDTEPLVDMSGEVIGNDDQVSGMIDQTSGMIDQTSGIDEHGPEAIPVQWTSQKRQPDSSDTYSHQDSAVANILLNAMHKPSSIECEDQGRSKVRYDTYGKIVSEILETLQSQTRKKALADLLSWIAKYECYDGEEIDNANF